MAEASSGNSIVNCCGFCSRQFEIHHKPKVLPCSHIHCSECIEGFVVLMGFCQCPATSCRQVSEIAVNDLPLAVIGENGKNENAVFCHSCLERVSSDHQKRREAIDGGHQTVVKSCDLYYDEVPTMGCSTCLAIFCVQCLTKESFCIGGAAHELKSLEKVMRELNEMKTDIMDKEKKTSKMLSITSEFLSDYDSETRELLETLHQARDDQINGLKAKYDDLESSLLTARVGTAGRMESFMEDVIRAQLLELNRSLLRLQAKIQQSNQVTFVTGYQDTVSEINALMSQNVSKLELEDMKTLDIKDVKKREIEAGIVISEYSSLTLSGLRRYPIPRSMAKVKVTKAYHNINGVDSHRGVTYVTRMCHTMWGSSCNSYFNFTCSRPESLCNAVERIDDTNRLSKCFIRYNNMPVGVQVYKDHIYSMIPGPPFKVYIHDLSGNLITSWDYADHPNYSIKFVILNDQVVIPVNSQLVVYSLDGKILAHKPCPLLGREFISMCAAGDDSLIISDSQSSRVFKYVLSSEEVAWVSTIVTSPQGVACYVNRYVLVTKRSSRTVFWIIDLETGDFLRKIKDPDRTKLVKANVFDLCVEENKVIVPRSSGKVLYYILR